MTPERWKQVTDVFHAALARDTAARPMFLEQACASDPALRDEVNAMLAAHVEAGKFGDVPIAGMAAQPVRLEPGAAVGPYRVDALIGEGGMGQVIVPTIHGSGATWRSKYCPPTTLPMPSVFAASSRKREPPAPSIIRTS
jgi:hypothetical protein